MSDDVWAVLFMIIIASVIFFGIGSCSMAEKEFNLKHEQVCYEKTHNEKCFKLLKDK